MTFDPDLVIDTSSPERGWDPFVEWLRSQDVDVDTAREIEIDTSSLDAKLTWSEPRPGAERKVRNLKLSSLPPLHPSRGESA